MVIPTQAVGDLRGKSHSSDTSAKKRRVVDDRCFIIENLVTMHALHQLQDKLPDDVAVMLSQIDGSLIHALQLVVVVLQFISRIKAVLVELSEQTGEPYGVQITHQIARPFLVVVTCCLVGYEFYHAVGIMSG